MSDLFENPMGLDGFEFVEFASPQPGVLEPVFELLGFEAVAKHRSKNVTLFRQGDINFILNAEPGSPAAYFAQEHGPSACGMAFRVKDAHRAYSERCNWVHSRWKSRPARWNCVAGDQGNRRGAAISH